ncbi:hypothetical protein LTR84_009726 [Exophiala bonariae]|uniref:Cyanovirin-N domain-containing protein n=1 Tax=Exophiala bonariae TaxID=1690606 RepID=A0AAV9NMV6_9EURO|nr:hypothetical protein LTR84_009726 [Exophiala bonariae]
MMRLFSSTAFVVTILTTFNLQTTYARATPLSLDLSTLAPRDTLSDHGSSCTAWKEEQPNGYFRLKMKCDKIGRGLKVCGSGSYANYGFSTDYVDNNNLGVVVQSPAYNSDASLEKLNFRYAFSSSGNSDMGSCDSNLVEVEHTIKNGWYNSMTCTNISPYLKVRAVLDLPGAFNQYSEWINNPGTVQTLERESWFGRPSAYAEWKLRDE